MSGKILFLNGPNLNMLGSREVEVYGTTTLAEIEQATREHAARLGFDIEFRQTNSESEFVDWVQEARGNCDGLVVNAGAYTHTSIAILDALKMMEVPVVEVHLSNILQREPFRSESYVARAARGIIAGFGGTGYRLAVDAINDILVTESRS